MKIIFTIILFFSWPVSSISGQQDNVDVLKSRLEYAIHQSDAFAAADAISGLRNFRVDPRTFSLDSAADIIIQKSETAYQWDPITGEELVRLFGPLEGLYDADSTRDQIIRGSYFWGLMSIGDRGKALEVWKKSEKKIMSFMETPYLFDRSGLPKDELAATQCLDWGIRFFILGLASSHDQEDRRKGVELARLNYDNFIGVTKNAVLNYRSTHPAIMNQMMEILTDKPRSVLNYCLIEAGLATDTAANPFLKDQPQTDIRFKLLKKTGFEDHARRVRLDNVIALGDYDSDSFVDVLIPGQGLWHNEKGSGKFKRVDKKLNIDIDGTSGAFADVDNDGLVDIIIIGPGKFDVHLQNKDHTFRTVVNSPDLTLKSPRGIGLFDGDADGLIDIYVCGYEESPDKVMRNKGDGAFEDVTKAWGFTGEDMYQAGRGVSPADYDGDGATDIYVSNYRLKRNTLWHNDGNMHFTQCASAPLFEKVAQSGAADSADRGVEGWHSIVKGATYWGNSLGSVWGDINNDGTLDLICANLAHPGYIIQGFSDISRVYVNRGNTFDDHTPMSGVHFCETNGSPLLADFNNDGVLDLSMTNVYRMYYNQFYQGVGDGSFKEVTCRTGAFASSTLGQAAGDFDNDGDLDWFVVDGDRGILLYANTLIENGKTPTKANWIELKLHGQTSINSMAYGARITVKAGKQIFIREVSGMQGISNCSDQLAHVGLGKYDGKVDVEVQLNGGRMQKIFRLKSGKRYDIELDKPKEKGKKNKPK